jgi:hypothetical protein
VLKLGEKTAFPFLATDANESSAKFSPDGKWIVYASDESGHPEVYAQPFSVEKGGKWQVSRRTALRRALRSHNFFPQHHCCSELAAFAESEK